MSPPAPSELVISDDPANRTLTAVISPDHLAPPVPGPSADQPSWAGLIRHARCADAGLDPDQWFPVSTEAAKARHEAAAAIAICGSCLVRAGCLVTADRARLRRRIAADHYRCGSALMHVTAAASAR